MRARGIRCPVCDGLLADVAETRADPESPSAAQGAVLRVVECGDCEVRYPTIEQLAPPDTWDRIRELGRERVRMARVG